MTAAAQLVVIRHAQTKANFAGRYLAETDVLSPIGEQQAARLAPVLARFEVSHVVHSGSVRVVQTLKAVAPALGGAEIRMDSRLREGAVGAWTGRSSRGMRADEARRFGVPVWELRPPGGESWSDIDDRLRGFIEEEIRPFAGRCLLVLGSGRANSLMLRRLCGTPWKAFERRQMLHTGISSLRSVTDSVLQLDQCVDHLPENLRTR